MKYLKCTFVFILIWYISSTGFCLFLQKLFYLIQSNDSYIKIYSILYLTVFIQNLSCFSAQLHFQASFEKNYF